MKVLVVDDVEINRRLLCAILESAGHDTFEACDGVEALAVLAHEPVDAIISDLLMPNMDGFNLCNGFARMLACVGCHSLLTAVPIPRSAT